MGLGFCTLFWQLLMLGQGLLLLAKLRQYCRSWPLFSKGPEEVVEVELLLPGLLLPAIQEQSATSQVSMRAACHLLGGMLGNYFLMSGSC